MRAVVRSIVPTLAIVGVLATTAVLVGSIAKPPRLARAWAPPAGYDRVATVDRPDGTQVGLWLGRVGPPKPGDCWYLAHLQADIGVSGIGWCGGLPGQPWLVRFAGVIAGATGDPAACWVRLNHGPPIPVDRGHFLALDVPPGLAAHLELLDHQRRALAQFADVPIGGAT
ncbi:MAG TPA: hypothetical protein VF163_04950 [Micromonosporaceae bacterium]